MTGIDERARGVMLRTLDVSALPGLVADKLEDGETVDVGWTPYGVAERDGRLFVVCTEGVGWEVTEEEPLAVDLYVRTPGTTEILPRWHVLLDPDEVRLAATGPEVDLADLVRRFGHRLEANFWTWHRQLTE